MVDGGIAERCSDRQPTVTLQQLRVRRVCVCEIFLHYGPSKSKQMQTRRGSFFLHRRSLMPGESGIRVDDVDVVV